MDISVIIPTLNREDVLCQTIKSVLKEKAKESKSHHIEVMIVDQTEKHASDTQNYLEQISNKGEVILIHKSTPSLPEARNLGISKAKGDVIIFIDDDVILQPGFFQAYVEAYADKEVKSVTGKVILANKTTDNILLQNQSSLKSYVRRLLMILLNRKKNFIISKLGLILRNVNADAKKIIVTDGGIGCNMSFRKKVFETVGLFDTHYVGNALREETDMFVRLKNKRLKTVYQPQACLYHMMDNTGGCRSIETVQYWEIYFYNQSYFYIKNFGFSKIRICFILIFDIIKCMQRGIPIKRILRESYDKARKNVLSNR